MCLIIERRPHETIALVVSCKFRKLSLVIHSNCVVPFSNDLICAIMEKRLHNTHCFSGLLEIHANCVVPLFQGGDLCVIIIEKRPHKTNFLSGFVQISKFVCCNPCKLCGLVFQGVDLCNNGKATL